MGYYRNPNSMKSKQWKKQQQQQQQQEKKRSGK